MRIFVTGASGWIGSAVVPELLGAGYTVVGLARSERAAAAVASLGAEVQPGDLNDLDTLRTSAAASDGVVHLGYNHDFGQPQEAARTDLDAIAALGTALEGTGRPFVVASGVMGLAPGRVATEHDVPDPAQHPRIAAGLAALAFADRGVRAALVRFAPTVHGVGDQGFIATLVGIARDKGVSGYIEDGANRWPAVHRGDAATLVRRAVQDAAAGSAVHAVAEEGVPARTIAEAIGRGLGLPVASIPAERAGEHFAWMGRFFSVAGPSSSAVTQASMDWHPSGPGLIEDLDAGHYFHRP